MKKKKINKLLFYLVILVIVLLTILIVINFIVFIYIFPKELNYFKKKLNEVDKFEIRVNIMENKFNEIFDIVMNFCDLFILKKVCYKNSTDFI